MKREYWEKFLIALGAIFYLFLFPHGIHGDGSIRYVGLRHLLATGEFQPVVYSFVGPLISSPLLLLGHLVKDEFWWISRFNTFVFLFSVWAFVRIFAAHWSGERRRLLVLLLFCASMFPKNITDYYSEVFSACLMALAFASWITKRFALGSILLCLSVWNTPGTLVGGALAVAYFVIKERKIRYLAILPLLPAGIMFETFLKFGTVFPSSYVAHAGVKSILPYSGLPGFSYPMFFGILSVLFSFGKGLLFYTPGLLGLFDRELWRTKERDFIWAGAFYLAGLILVFSRWWAWSGDWFWGPRFYLFASFLSPVIFVILYRREAGLLAQLFWFFGVALSLWVGCEGILFGQDFLEDCMKDGGAWGFLCHYVPEYSALWRLFISSPEIRGRKVAYLIYFLLVTVTVLWGPGVELAKRVGRKLVGAFRQLRDADWAW